MAGPTESDGFTSGTVLSKDGTQIGYRSIGRGHGIAFVQGTMGTIENFTHLAHDLSDSFTLHLIERRGRGISPKPFAAHHSIARDVEDIDAVAKKTGARYVFGLSSGGVIALQAVLTSPSLEKVAVYEPALLIDDDERTEALQRFQKAMARGDTAQALVVAMKTSEMGPPFLNHIPDWLLVSLTKRLLQREDKKAAAGADRFWHTVAPTLQFDFEVIAEMSSKWRSFQSINRPVLLLGGSKSPTYLTKALDALEDVIPESERIELEGLDHGAAWNYHERQNAHGNPKRVAQELRRYFAK
jgi:pimeloyl-ACP methyl ester carboxylesterase